MSVPAADQRAEGDAPPEHRERINAGLRLRQAPALLKRWLRNPRWAAENVRLLWWRRREARKDFELADHEPYVVDEETAIVSGLGATREAYEAARAAFWAPSPAPDEPRASWDARQSLQSLVSVAVRIAAPDVMVETGVARGYSSAIALAAMRDNGSGQLYSVDLPALEFEGKAELGEMIPETLRDRWSLELGPSRLVLPDLLERVGPIDLFLADADHTYPSQLTEYRTAWEHLRPGGMLISDDVHNRAFTDAADQFGARPYLVGSVAANNAIGLMVKK